MMRQRNRIANGHLYSAAKVMSLESTLPWSLCILFTLDIHHTNYVGLATVHSITITDPLNISNPIIFAIFWML